MKKVFLTGASSGIGLATAERLCADGHEVWGTSRNRERIPAFPRLHAVALDLADSAQLRQSFQAALADAGHFDVLINNAGSGFFGSADSLSLEDLRKHFQTLVFGHIELCHLALEAMERQQCGLIINVTSLVAELPVPFMACYNAAKSAMASYTISLQLELATSKVRLIDVQPGDINTGFNNVIQTGRTDDPRIQRAWAVSERNMKKAPKPDLVAQQIAGLLDSEDPPPRVIVGDFFQSKVAPFINQLLPQRVRLWGLRQYYGI